MHMSLHGRRPRLVSGALVLATTAGLVATPAAIAAQSHSPARGHTAADRTLGRYTQHNLVADTPGKAQLTDPDLVNAWGLSFAPGLPAWVSDFGTGVSTLYSGGVNGSPAVKQPITVRIPGGVGVTGQVANTGNQFVVRSGNASGPARFIFVSVRGIISGWNPNVPAAGSMDAQTAVTIPTAAFTGAAMSGNTLFAADFHNAKVDVFNGRFEQIKRPGAFRDARIPRGYAPFGIETVNGRVIVTYAKQDPTKEFDVAGKGHGFVDMFTTSGRLVRRIATRGALNSPWGIAQAPKSFGAAGGALLIGNFGDGHISAYSPRTGRFLGQLANAQRHTLVIPGLWAIKFGNGIIGTPNSLVFTSGPSGGQHGLFGTLTAGASSTKSAPTTPPANPASPY